MNQLIVCNTLDQLTEEVLQIVESDPHTFLWNMREQTVTNVHTCDCFYFRVKDYLALDFLSLDGLCFTTIIYKDGVDLPFFILEHLHALVQCVGAD